MLTHGTTYFDWPEQQLFTPNLHVSKWSIAEQLYHITLANASIPKLIERLQAGTIGEENAKPKPEMIAIIEQGILPKGRQAPARVTPPQDLTLDLLARDYARMKKASERLEDKLDILTSIKRTFPHPFLGPLNAAQWLCFMDVHTKHHMQIVDAIGS